MSYECVKTHIAGGRTVETHTRDPAAELDRRAREHAKRYFCSYEIARRAVLHNEPELAAACAAAPPAEPAGDTLDRAARKLMAKTPGVTYQQALHDVLEVDPDLKNRYNRGE